MGERMRDAGMLWMLCLGLSSSEPLNLSIVTHGRWFFSTHLETPKQDGYVSACQLEVNISQVLAVQHLTRKGKAQTV